VSPASLSGTRSKAPRRARRSGVGCRDARLPVRPSRTRPKALLGLALLVLTGKVLFQTPLQAWRSSQIEPPRDAKNLGPLSARLPTSEGMRPDPIDFSKDELRELNRRFGVHGPQPALAQLFTEGLDQLQPLRNHTLGRLEDLRPLIITHSRRQGINPMLVAAVLFDELQHAKPGEDNPIAVRSGLFNTQGPAQLGFEEMVKQGQLPASVSPEQITEARLELLDPDRNVELLVGKFARLSRALGMPRGRVMMASGSSAEAKALATLAYLHNGKLDYPGRILRYMQDPALHALIYGRRSSAISALI
jgi:hypothetical protein